MQIFYNKYNYSTLVAYTQTHFNFSPSLFGCKKKCLSRSSGVMSLRRRENFRGKKKKIITLYMSISSQYILSLSLSLSYFRSFSLTLSLIHSLVRYIKFLSHFFFYEFTPCSSSSSSSSSSLR